MHIKLAQIITKIIRLEIRNIRVADAQMFSVRETKLGIEGQLVTRSKQLFG